MAEQNKILIVDDEAGIVDEVKDYLAEEGYSVRSADTGKEGIQTISEFKPQVLILDMKLPDMSGIDVLRACKDISPATKVIVNTGYVDQKLIDEAEELGRDVFLQKPFDLEKIREEIDRLLES